MKFLKLFIGLVLISLIWSDALGTAAAEETECNYDRANPSIENARVNILTSKFHCAKMEINDFFEKNPKDSRGIADAYVILAHAEYGLEKDSAVVIDCFFLAFRANPGWYGKLHFNHPRFERYRKIGLDRARIYFGETSLLVITGGGGISFAASPAFGDRWKTGYHGVIGLGMRAVRFIEILARLEIQGFDVEKQIWVYDSVYETESGDCRAILLGVDGRFNLFMMNVRPGRHDSNSRFRFYLMFGLGAAFVDVSEIVLKGTEPVAGRDETNLYFNVGFSAEFRIYKRLRIFAQGRYVHIDAPDIDYSMAPMSIGVRL